DGGPASRSRRCATTNATASLVNRSARHPATANTAAATCAGSASSGVPRRSASAWTRSGSCWTCPAAPTWPRSAPPPGTGCVTSRPGSPNWSGSGTPCGDWSRPARATARPTAARSWRRFRETTMAHEKHACCHGDGHGRHGGENKAKAGNCHGNHGAHPDHGYAHTRGHGHADHAHGCGGATVPAPGAAYVCPMCPDVRQPGPGACPHCGMALEPELPAPDAGEDPEYIDFRRRFVLTLPLTAAVVALAMWAHRLSLSGTTRSWLELLLSVPVVLWAGWPFLGRWARSIRHRSPNMWTLIGTGVIAAFAYSLAATLAPDLFPAGFHMHGRVAVYYEAAAVIVLLTLLGQLLELRARAKTSAALQALLALSPPTARRVRDDGSEEDVPLAHVQVGDRLRVRPGEKVPVDGIVLEGRSLVDESM